LKTHGDDDDDDDDSARRLQKKNTHTHTHAQVVGGVQRGNTQLRGEPTADNGTRWLAVAGGGEGFVVGQGKTNTHTRARARTTVQYFTASI
jgi:hypothetical protein